MRYLLPVTTMISIMVGSLPGWAQQGGPRYEGHMWDGGWYGWILGPLMMIVFLAIAVIVIVLIVRWLGGVGHAPSSNQAPPSGKSPQDILKERFARGEIDKKEFEDRKRVLEE